MQCNMGMETSHATSLCRLLFVQGVAVVAEIWASIKSTCIEEIQINNTAVSICCKILI